MSGRRAVALNCTGAPFAAADARDSFYDILGVHPVADMATIKAAYRSAMREFHPDRAMSSEEADAIHEYACILNQVYAVLADPESRELYDSVAGFSLDAVNPFQDDSFPVDQIFVDEVQCIGCGKCVRACPAAFFIEESKYGRARVVAGANAMQLQEEVDIAVLTCPVDCIHWVTSPQLSLLETALSKMARVDAFVMMRNQRSPGNVFEEAHRAWTKRQANLAALRDQQDWAAAGGSAAPGSGWASWFSSHVEMRGPGSRGASPESAGDSSSGSDASSLPTDRSARRVADLAALLGPLKQFPWRSPGVAKMRSVVRWPLLVVKRGVERHPSCAGLAVRRARLACVDGRVTQRARQAWEACMLHLAMALLIVLRVLGAGPRSRQQAAAPASTAAAFDSRSQCRRQG